MLQVSDIKTMIFWVCTGLLALYAVYAITLLVTVKDPGMHVNRPSVKSTVKVVVGEVVLQWNIARYSLFRWAAHFIMTVCFVFFVVYYFVPSFAGVVTGGDSAILIHDIMAAGLVVSSLLLLARRFFTFGRHVSPALYEDLTSTFLIFAIAVTGILLAGVKYAYTKGGIIAHVVPGVFINWTAVHYSHVFFLHIALIVTVVVLIPFTKLVHMFTVPLNLLLTLLEKGSREDIYGRWSRVPQSAPQETD